MGFFDTIKSMINEFDEKNKVSLKCPNCGANIVGKASERAIKCEFCGSFANNDKYSPIINNPLKDFAKNREFEKNTDFYSDFDFDDDLKESAEWDDFAEDAPVFAWIEKEGLFFEGEIPGINFSKVNFCETYRECIEKLRAKYYEEKSRAFFKHPKQNVRQIREEHPKAKIIKLD